jgi:hypothetical protein
VLLFAHGIHEDKLQLNGKEIAIVEMGMQFLADK